MVQATVWFRISIILAAASAIFSPVTATTHQLPVDDVPISGSFDDLFTVGRETGADHELLFGLVDVAFAPDGELYVLEERNHRILVHGPDGAFRRSFARQGQGPGEFQLPMTLAVTRAGEVAVWDFQLRSYVLFDREGNYLRNARRGDWRGGPSRGTLRSWPGGGVVYLPRLLHDRGDPEEEITRGAIMHDALAPDRGSEELLAVHHPKRRGQEVAGVLTLTNGPKFAPDARWDALPDGRVAVVDEVAYAVRIVDPESGAEFRIERPMRPEPVTEEDRERERSKRRREFENPAGVARFGSGGGSSSIDINSMVDALEFADLLPVIRDLRVDFQGRLWIQRYGATFDDDGPIDIVTAAGEYLGTLPAMAMPDAFGPDGMVAWMEGGRNVEVERVIVRRLPESLR